MHKGSRQVLGVAQRDAFQLVLNSRVSERSEQAGGGALSLRVAVRLR
ncbi:MAG: hypothetical protein ACI9KE_006215 [Polyangiales bacterium]|jgi:hypothetical protein